jgi:hypothetical protein
MRRRTVSLSPLTGLAIAVVLSWCVVLWAAHISRQALRAIWP